MATKRRYFGEHGLHSRLYRIWRAMHFRCYQPSHKAYPRYGGRGILVCEEWRDYNAFRAWAVPAGYADDLEIDRIDNARGYSADNCRWATRRQNQLNKTDNIPPILAFGETRSLSEWTDDARCVAPYRLVWRRIQNGWSPELAMSTPSQAGGIRPVGTQLRGERVSGAKLTADLVREIRASSLSESQLGSRYGISPSLAGLVKRRKVWAHVE